MQYNNQQLEYIQDNITIYDYEDIENNYLELLNDIYEPVELAGMTIYASDMRKLDPIMFRCSVSDYSSEDFIELFDQDNNVFYVRDDDLDNISSELEDLEGAKHDR